MQIFKNKNNSGFTLIEAVVGIAIFSILSAGILGTFSLLSQSVKAGRDKVILASTAADYLEVVRNLPYSQVGTVNGNPSGSLPDLANAQTMTLGGVLYRVYYEVTYTDDSADGTILAGTDPFPNDYKQVKMFMLNTANNVVTSFVTNVSPKGLEGLSNAGALYVKVFDSSGQPISGASIAITSVSLSPPIILNRSTDASGNWIEVGLPDAVNEYHVVVTKNGYSADQTYPITVQNPNPAKPDSTIVNGQVTQVSFSIDLLSNLTINTYNQTCQAISGINLNVAGSKLIGTNPNVLKFSNNYTSNGSGTVALNNIEWDTYTPTLLTGQSVMVYGSSPIQQISVLPSTSQIFSLILGPLTANSLLVIVKDSATGQPLENALAHLHKGSPGQDWNGTTGGSVWTQNDWTGGAGQAMFIDPAQYFSKSDTIDTLTQPTAVRLAQNGGNYYNSGTLESSTFDSGTSSTQYTTINWAPTSQSQQTAVTFQLASNNDNATWNFIGPDGTAATYYTVPGTSISAAHNNNRYIRYKMYLSSADTAITPALTSVSINYVSGCFTPGQTIFTGLSADNDYSLDVSLAGYSTQNISNININGNQSLEILLGP